MAASVWSGYLTFGLISMPVRLFSGARSSGISFNMLHRDDLQRVKQQYYCPADNRVVERSEIVKGYEFRKDEYVVIEPEEIKKIEPQTAKTMEILEFVKSSEVDPVFFESSYYMLPEEAGRRPYALLTKALEESEYVAIAKLTMHNREYTVFLRPHEGGLMLHTMYYAEEVRTGRRLWRARSRTERRGSQSRAPVDRSPGRRVGPGKVSRHFPGKCEEADRDQTRRRQDHRSREAEKAGPGRGSDGCPQTKPGRNGRKEEAGSAGPGSGFGKAVERESVKQLLAVSS